jgi:predicted transcriptional regulator of viral defense system
MEKGNYISTLLRSKKTVFSFKDIALLWGDSGAAARVRVNYYKKNGELYRIRQGLYAKDKNYNRFELAVKIYTPSYISFETVLGKAGVTFQHYGQIFIASYLTREIKADGQTYSYKKIKDSVLTNNIGIEHKENYFIASPERAFLDVLYLNKNYHFDDLSGLDWDKVFEILPIYSNKRMEREVKGYHNVSKTNK